MTSPGACCSITEETSIHYLVSSVETNQFDLIKLLDACSLRYKNSFAYILAIVAVAMATVAA